MKSRRKLNSEKRFDEIIQRGKEKPHAGENVD